MSANIRYAITHLEAGIRTFAEPKTGGFTYAERHRAQEVVDGIHRSTSKETLHLIFGGPLLVKRVLCDDRNDPVRILASDDRGT